MQASAVLAIWTDCKPGFEPLFERWYQHEHLPERLAVPGFQRGRRYEAVEGAPGYELAPRFMTCYHADTVEVFRSQAYQQRLDNPTPLTRQVMSEAVANLSRTVCHCEAHGRLSTATYALVLPLSGESAEREKQARDLRGSLSDRLASDDELARFEIWLSDDQKTDEQADGNAARLSAEQALRGRDQSIAGCVVVETLREASVLALQAAVPPAFGIPPDTSQVYRLLCEAQAPTA
ncbi:MAG: hypothetical protein AB8C46_06805 [Burkholderiaceae bacterium]